jgi:hypothetical protein
VSDDSPIKPDDEHVDVDDPFEIPDEVEKEWEDEQVGEGEAPSG